MKLFLYRYARVRRFACEWLRKIAAFPSRPQSKFDAVDIAHTRTRIHCTFTLWVKYQLDAKKLIHINGTRRLWSFKRQSSHCLSTQWHGYVFSRTPPSTHNWCASERKSVENGSGHDLLLFIRCCSRFHTWIARLKYHNSYQLTYGIEWSRRCVPWNEWHRAVQFFLLKKNGLIELRRKCGPNTVAWRKRWKGEIGGEGGSGETIRSEKEKPYTYDLFFLRMNIKFNSDICTCNSRIL